MGFSEAIATCFRKYVTFSGRARRPEYWWFFLFILLGSVVAVIVDGVIFGFGSLEEPARQVVRPIFSLATFLPFLAAGWRRMHDTGRPGWYLLIPLAVSLATTLGVLLVIFGFAELEQSGADEAVLRTAASTIGVAGFAIAVLVQIAVTVLIFWWLSRPTQEGVNKYGDEPKDG